MKVQVPMTTADITIEQYAKYSMIAEDSDKEFVGHKAISIFLGIELKDVLQIPQAQAEELLKDVDDMLESTPTMEYTFTHRGTKYGFIPDLEKLTLGEYVDLEDYIKDPKDWNKAAAVMFRPVSDSLGKLYNIEPYVGDKRSQEDAKDFPASHFINATVFFYSLSNQLLVNSAFYLAKLIDSKEMKSLKTTVSEDNSQKDGDGSTHSTRLVKEMRRNLKKLLK